MDEPRAISSEDVRLIASSRSKKRYTEITEDEHSAYIRVSNALQSLGNLLQSKLPDPSKFEVRTTSGFNINSGVRSYIPKDLWVSVSPKENAQRLAGMPQLFMIVSERGVEYGYGASVSPSDFSQQTVRQIVRRAAPVVFQQLPSPGSPEALSIENILKESGPWYFRRKHRLTPNQQEIPSFDEWLNYLRSPEGAKNAAGTISRYLLPDEVDDAQLEYETERMANAFEQLLDRDWREDVNFNEPAQRTDAGSHPKDDPEMEGSKEFAKLLSSFLTCFDDKRSEAFSVDEELGAAMQALQTWLKEVPAVASRSTMNVKVSVGQGGWTKTPWIALLDNRETTSTQRGRYIVFLIAEDLSVTYLTLNQGMTELRNQLGQQGAAEEMVRVAMETRPLVQELQASGFQFDNDIDLHSSTSAARNYEIGTIAHVALQTDALPNDAVLHRLIGSLLKAYDLIIETDSKLPGERQPRLSEEEAEEIPIATYGIDDALEELFLEREEVELYLDLWANKKNLILQGAPGVGKSFIAKRLAFALIGSKDDRKVRTVQFHQSYSYEDFVQGYRPNGAQGFELQNGIFYEFRDRALSDPSGTYVVIIDEINRGNLSKILGELMLLIEPDKRGPSWKARLAYAKDGDPDFFVPENLFILGMMNTADRSLSMVDYALRRRFAFATMDPLFGAPKFRAHLGAYGVPEEIITRIVNGMSDLNQVIESDRINLGPGFRVGHSFFTPTKPMDDPESWYRRIVETEIYPLLEEYWFDSPETADQWRDRLLG